MINDYKIAVIGCGNLGLSIVHGLLADKNVKAENITATRRNVQALKHLADAGVTTTSDNLEAIKSAELIVLGLKPYKIMDVLKDLAPHFDSSKHILVSLATGVHIADIQRIVGEDIPVYRAMPNTAADVETSMTCVCGNKDSARDLQVVLDCFSAVGDTIVIDESLMDSATVLGACGIAYVLRFIRAMIQGGIEIGFDAKTASHIATQTVKGAAELLIQRNQHPEYEIDKVTTPRGCTIAGLNEMEHNGFSSALIKDEGHPTVDIKALLQQYPVLGICYGAQLACHQYGGVVAASDKREYGRAGLHVTRDDLFHSVEEASQVWMSHGDTIKNIPDEMTIIAHTDNIPVAAYKMNSEPHPFYGIQFHPE
ncbi:unnamed protein product, partial [Cyprideis torosa]